MRRVQHGACIIYLSVCFLQVHYGTLIGQKSNVARLGIKFLIGAKAPQISQLNPLKSISIPCRNRSLIGPLLSTRHPYLLDQMALHFDCGELLICRNCNVKPGFSTLDCRKTIRSVCYSLIVLGLTSPPLFRRENNHSLTNILRPLNIQDRLCEASQTV